MSRRAEIRLRAGQSRTGRADRHHLLAAETIGRASTVDPARSQRTSILVGLNGPMDLLKEGCVRALCRHLWVHLAHFTEAYLSDALGHPLLPINGVKRDSSIAAPAEPCTQRSHNNGREYDTLAPKLNREFRDSPPSAHG